MNGVVFPSSLLPLFHARAMDPPIAKRREKKKKKGKKGIKSVSGVSTPVSHFSSRLENRETGKLVVTFARCY